MKQVKRSSIGQVTVGVLATLGHGAVWLTMETAQAQVRPAVTFELPEVCQIDLDETVPQPGQAPELLPQRLLGQNSNPLLTPTQPEDVDITRQQPISLEQAIELAYRNNPDLEIARLAVQRSQAALDEARASLTPTVDLNTRVDVLTNPAQGLEGDEAGNVLPVAALTGNVSAAYDIITGGERPARIRAAELQLQQQQLTLEQAQEDTRAQTTLTYYDVQGARERIRIGRDFLAESCRNLRDAILFF
jgi:outer membrane protein TolC